MNEERIRAIIDDRIKAVRTGNVDLALAHLAPDIVTFDVVGPLRFNGTGDARKRIEEWFSSFQGPIGFEVHELAIAAGDDVAFSRGLHKVSATKADGGSLEMWWRATICYRFIDGVWNVVHEHNSVPFDPGSGTASIDLVP